MVELFHNQVVTSYVVHVIFVLDDCVETCEVPFVYTLSWISQLPVFGNYT